MPRFLCSSCHEVVEMAGLGRFDWCSSCGTPLTAEDRLPVQFVSQTPAPGAAQASGGPAGEAERAAPALATTTNPIAATSRTPKVSPSTT
jgi:hypothetical protein